MPPLQNTPLKYFAPHLHRLVMVLLMLHWTFFEIYLKNMKQYDVSHHISSNSCGPGVYILLTEIRLKVYSIYNIYDVLPVNLKL